MRFARNRLGTFAGGLVFLGVVLTSHGAVMMIDFGPTAATGSDRLNSPYHTDHGTFTDTTWNNVIADVAAGGLLWSDGSVAGGISLNLGRTTAAGVTTLDLNQAVLNGALGGTVNSGVYSGTSPERDGIFTGAGARYLGLQIGGLSAGRYDLYVTGRNTSTASSNSPTFYFGTSAAAGNFSVLGMATERLVYRTAANPSTASWADGQNYSQYTINLAAGEYLNLATIGSGNELRGFLNSLQIAQVQIPEPSSLLLLFFGFAGLSRLRRSHRARARTLSPLETA